MKILVTGAAGQVGWELSRSLMPLGEVIALTRQQCDLSRPETLGPLIEQLAPDLIVNAAAYTAVDRAESENALAMTVNGEAVGVLAEAAKRRGALLIHYSTDYVFDGDKENPYVEEDAVNPINAYGRSKLFGEQAIASVDCEALILRTTWVYASRGANFVRTMLRLGAERIRLAVVADQFGAPTWARNLADATALIAAQAMKERRSGDFDGGIFHLSAQGRTSWHGFAEEIFSLVRRQLPQYALQVEEVATIGTAEYPTPATRPHNSELSGDKVAARFSLRLPDWHCALATCLMELDGRT